METLSYQRLCDIYREEKTSNSLYALDKEHEDSLAQLFSELKGDPARSSEYENAKRTALALNRLRKQKILVRTLGRISESELSAMSEKEREYYQKIVDLNKVEQKRYEERVFLAPQPKKKDIKSIKKIKILKDIPAYRGADSKDYGPYSEGQVIEVAQKEAEWMIKGQLAINID